MKLNKHTTRTLISAIALSLICFTIALAKKPDNPGGGGGGGGGEEPSISYTVIDLLGIPGGASLQSEAWSVSEPDVVTGTLFIVGNSYIRFQNQQEGEWHPALWTVTDDGSFQSNQIDQGLPAGSRAARASSVNNLGWFTINSITLEVGGNDALIDIPDMPLQLLPTDGPRATVAAVNNIGDCVGRAGFPDAGYQGALWMLNAGVSGDPINLGSFNPFDISDTGVLAGEDEFGLPAIATLDTQDNLTVTSLGVLPGYDRGRANAISSNGEWVAGYCRAIDGPWEAFVWSEATGIMTGLGRIGGVTSEAQDVNDSGHVVGWSDTGGGRHPQTAVLWKDGQMIDLNNRVDTKAHLTFANGINNAGHIVGFLDLSKPTSEQQGFLLMPNP